jgi:hypothetical protein
MAISVSSLDLNHRYQKQDYGMKSTSVLLPILRLGVSIGLAYTLVGPAGAQIPGPGQVGGMGQGGAPAGEFPSDRGNVTYGQRYTPAEDLPPERMPGNKDMNEDKNKNASGDSPGDSSAEASAQSGKRGTEGKVDSSIETGTPETGSPGAANTGAQRK